MKMVIAQVAAFAFVAGLVVGTAVAVKVERSHVRWIEARGRVAVDGKDLPMLDVCWRGCRTEPDETCAAFRALLRDGR